MPQTYYTAKPDAEKRFQCRHILPAGSRCACPCLRGEELCYFHHTTRRPVPKWENETPKPLRATFALPAPEDHRAIQHGEKLIVGQLLQRALYKLLVVTEDPDGILDVRCSELERHAYILAK